MRLSVIIVSYNTQLLTCQAIQSVIDDIESSTDLKGQSEIWVVDNHSTDDSVAAVKKLANMYSYLHVVENKENVGFAKANNQAIEHAEGQYILLLNSDTIVPRGTLHTLITTFETHPPHESTSILASHHGQLDRLGIVAATLINADGTLQRQGGSFPTLFTLASHMLFLDDLPIIGQFFPSTQHTGKNQRRLAQVDWVGGTAMMVKRSVFTEIGKLDQNIFMYGEDVEFCMRARDHHWDIVIEPKARITHLGSASSSSANAIQGEFKGYLYIWSKHKPFWQLPLVKGILSLGAFLRMFIFGTIQGNTQKAGIYRTLLKSVIQ